MAGPIMTKLAQYGCKPSVLCLEEYDNSKHSIVDLKERIPSDLLSKLKTDLLVVNSVSMTERELQRKKGAVVAQESECYEAAAERVTSAGARAECSYGRSLASRRADTLRQSIVRGRGAQLLRDCGGWPTRVRGAWEAAARRGRASR
ncbi:jg7850, partial [Pararge aegeria aegeria]